MRTAATKFVGDPIRARHFTRVSWFAASIAIIVSASLYAPERPASLVQGALQIGGAAFPLALSWRGQRANATAAAPSITRSYVWIIAAALIFVIFAATLGVGIS